MTRILTAVLWLLGASLVIVLIVEGADLLVAATEPATFTKSGAISPGTAVAGLVRVALLGSIGWFTTGALLRRTARSTTDDLTEGTS